MPFSIDHGICVLRFDVLRNLHISLQSGCCADVDIQRDPLCQWMSWLVVMRTLYLSPVRCTESIHCKVKSSGEVDEKGR